MLTRVFRPETRAKPRMLETRNDAEPPIHVLVYRAETTVQAPAISRCPPGPVTLSSQVVPGAIPLTRTISWVPNAAGAYLTIAAAPVRSLRAAAVAQATCGDTGAFVATSGRGGRCTRSAPKPPAAAMPLPAARTTATAVAASASHRRTRRALAARPSSRGRALSD